MGVSSACTVMLVRWYVYRPKKTSWTYPRPLLMRASFKLQLPQVQTGPIRLPKKSCRTFGVLQSYSKWGTWIVQNWKIPIKCHINADILWVPPWAWCVTLTFSEQANYFQNLVGLLRWIIELGRLDIHVHVSMLSTFLAAPHQGHLNEVLHIFAYLKCYNTANENTQ